VLGAAAALDFYAEPGFYERLAAAGERFYGEFRRLVARSGVTMRLQYVGPRFGMYFGVAEGVALAQADGILYPLALQHNTSEADIVLQEDADVKAAIRPLLNTTRRSPASLPRPHARR
jgi:glutamate-1-semialdehyde aminotransferase